MKQLIALLSLIWLFWSCQQRQIDGQPHTTEKKTYVPSSLRSLDLNSDAGEWSYQRSVKSANVVVFWQKEFGTNPAQATNIALRFDVNDVLNRAERVYQYYRDTLQFTDRRSRLDSLRLMIMIYYQDEWMATGAGYDNVVGALWVSPAAVKNGPVLAHELGHSFQYQIHCDGGYGYRDQPYVGSFWEQCAQYMERQLFPADALDDLGYFVSRSYQNFSHEDIRYQSFHLQEYWKQKRGVNFLGRLWRSAVSPEHPLQTYKRLAGLSQEQLNDEIADYAMRCLTWDFPNGQFARAQAIQNNIRFTTSLTKDNEGYYHVETATAPQCYGFNAFQLALPKSGASATVQFEGISSLNFTSLQGWRYGFVAVNSNELSATYGELGKTSRGQMTFTVPSSTDQLWFIVSGAPQTHFNHVWGLADNLTPRFPYRVRFTNTHPTL